MKQVHYLINKKNPNYGRPLTTHELRALVESGKVRNHATVETHYSDGSKWYGSVYAVLDEYFWYLSPRQRAYLKFLGYTGSMYITQDDCHHAIETLKKINPNGVDGLDYDDLVDQECNNYNDDCTFDDDTFKEAADNYVFYQKNDFDSLPPELQPPRLSTVVTEIIKVERIASIAGGIVGLIVFSNWFIYGTLNILSFFFWIGAAFIPSAFIFLLICTIYNVIHGKADSNGCAVLIQLFIGTLIVLGSIKGCN